MSPSSHGWRSGGGGGLETFQRAVDLMYHQTNLPSLEISAVELELSPAIRTIWELFRVDAGQKHWRTAQEPNIV